MLGRVRAMLAAFVAGAFTLTGCHSHTHQAETPVAAAEPTQSERAVRVEAEPRGEGDGVRPVDPREAHERAELMEAVEGLDFESGVVTVTEPIEAASDDDVAAAIARGRELIGLNKITEGMRHFAEAIRMAPGNAATYIDLGMALRAKGETDFEIVAFRTAVERDPASTDARFNLGGALWRDTQRDAAITTLDELVDLDPDYGKAHERLAIWRYYAGDYASAWDHVHKARELKQPLPPQFLDLLESRMADPG